MRKDTKRFLISVMQGIIDKSIDHDCAEPYDWCRWCLEAREAINELNKLDQLTMS